MVRRSILEGWNLNIILFSNWEWTIYFILHCFLHCILYYVSTTILLENIIVAGWNALIPKELFPSCLYNIAIEIYTIPCFGQYDVPHYFVLDCKLHCILIVSLTQKSNQWDLPILSETLTSIPPLQCTAPFTAYWTVHIVVNYKLCTVYSAVHHNVYSIVHYTAYHIIYCLL